MDRKSITIWLLLIMATACNQKQEAPWPYGVKYEVFVRAFADGNGDGIGDLKGLTAKLDYLQDLGVNGVWLMPIMKSPTSHKYDVVDYKSIDPEYGTIEDFKEFVREAHRRDIKVVIDLILNHTGSDHPWFQNALKDKHSPYRDYYVWAKKDSIRGQLSKKKVTLDSDNITQWHPANGDTLAEHYYGYFWGGMPDLNFDNPKVKNEFVDIGKFWLSDMGIDGFRLDAARHIFPADRAADNHAFWIWFRQAMEKINPKVYLVGEVWSSARDVAPYLRGLPALFNFDMGYAITSAVKAGKDTGGLIRKYKEISDFYGQTTPEYLDAPFLKNHDQNRILSELEDNVDKARAAAGILFTLPGTPYVYYGEEIGMRGMKPDEYIRESFIWDVGKNDPLQTSWEQPKFSSDKTVVPFTRQQEDPQSLYNFYRKLIHYRNSSAALTRGSIEATPTQVSEVVSFIRSSGNERVLALHNISDVEVTLNLEGPLAEFANVDFDFLGTSRLNGKELTMPAYTTLILR